MHSTHWRTFSITKVHIQRGIYVTNMVFPLFLILYPGPQQCLGFRFVSSYGNSDPLQVNEWTDLICYLLYQQVGPVSAWWNQFHFTKQQAHLYKITCSCALACEFGWYRIKRRGKSGLLSHHKAIFQHKIWPPGYIPQGKLPTTTFTGPVSESADFGQVQSNDINSFQKVAMGPLSGFHL